MLTIHDVGVNAVTALYTWWGGDEWEAASSQRKEENTRTRTCTTRRDQKFVLNIENNLEENNHGRNQRFLTNKMPQVIKTGRCFSRMSRTLKTKAKSGRRGFRRRGEVVVVDEEFVCTHEEEIRGRVGRI